MSSWHKLRKFLLLSSVFRNHYSFVILTAIEVFLPLTTSRAWDFPVAEPLPHPTLLQCPLPSGPNRSPPSPLRALSYPGDASHLCLPSSCSPLEYRFLSSASRRLCQGTYTLPSGADGGRHGVCCLLVPPSEKRAWAPEMLTGTTVPWCRINPTYFL